MRALVVGGSGYLGAAVADRLAARGLRVTCLSRTSSAPSGESLTGDVRAPRLGLPAPLANELASELTHIVSCFGSVDWGLGPTGAMEVHGRGTEALLSFAAGCKRLERLVHVSSVLVHGRADGVVGNRELDVGQSFRSWYEYGKFLAERAVRASNGVGWRVVRLGPVLGVDGPVPPSPSAGLAALLPTLLRGYPVHAEAAGEFPCYAGEVGGAAEVIAEAVTTVGGARTWTWYDPEEPTLAEVLTRLCAPWGVVPRLVDVPIVARAAGLAARRVGIPRAMLAYGSRWPCIDRATLAELPVRPVCAPGYVEATGAALRERGLPGRRAA